MELPPLDSLQPDEIFVFQSTHNGFHGAGTAGYAWKGHIFNWRDDAAFSTAWASQERVPGLRAVLRQARGLQHGTQGLGWSIHTMQWNQRARKFAPINPKEIRAQLDELAKLPNTAIFASIGTGVAGHSPSTMWEVYKSYIYQENWFLIYQKQRVPFEKFFNSVIHK